MALGLLGLKVGMTQIYTEAGMLEPVTVLQVGPCPYIIPSNRIKSNVSHVEFCKKFLTPILPQKRRGVDLVCSRPMLLSKNIMDISE